MEIISSHNKTFFAKAEQAASLSTYKKQCVGCVVTLKNKIISTGFNQNRPDPLMKFYDQYRGIGDEGRHTLHAEVNALKPLIDTDIDWNKVSIYVYRKRKDQEFGMARPCKACMHLIKDLGIKNVFYTTDDGYAYEEIL